MSTLALPAVVPDDQRPAPARIGPNAVLRVAEALGELPDGGRTRRAVFEAAGLASYLDTPPAAMVDEREVIALHAALRNGLDGDTAERVSFRAGELTGAYLLAHRIPAPVRRLLPLLPRTLASRLLLQAMARNAWTFAGSGAFAFAPGRPVQLTLTDCPLCRHASATRPQCTYYAATFLHLFRSLVAEPAQIAQTRCRAMGDPACEMAIDW